MNQPSPNLFPLTDNPIVNGLTNGTYWQLDATRTLTWGISDFGSFKWPDPNAAITDIGAAYAAFAPYVNVRFVYGGDFSDPTKATTDLVVTGDPSGVLFNDPNVVAEGFFPNDSLDYAEEPIVMQGHYPTAAGDVWFNLQSPLVTGASSYAPGSGVFTALLHEIGHTLGLKHPHDDGGTGRPTFSDLGFSAFDQDWFTIMSYNDTYSFGTSLWHPATPMLGDIIALQYIYGVNLSTNAGDTVHKIVNNNVYQTLFDPSGQNTLDFSSSGQSWAVDLGAIRGGTLDHIPYDVGFTAPIQNLANPTSFYWLYGSFQNVVGSAQADVIVGGPGSERLDGGAGNDQITAGGGDDTLIGGAGDDTIDGGTGHSIAYLSGTAGSYQTSVSGSIRYMSGPDGNDTYTNVSRFHFDDVSVAYDINGDAGEAYRLYKAAFNRAPDLGGMGYQMHALDSGLTLAQVAGNFIASPEFQSKYGSVSDTQFITLLYQNVLSRAPDSGGLQFHLSELAQGESRADLLTHFSESPENQADVLGQIQNGIVYTG